MAEITELVDKTRGELQGEYVVVGGEEREITEVTGMAYDPVVGGMAREPNPNATDVGVKVEGEDILTMEDFKGKLVSGDWEMKA